MEQILVEEDEPTFSKVILVGTPHEVERPVWPRVSRTLVFLPGRASVDFWGQLLTCVEDLTHLK